MLEELNIQRDWRQGPLPAVVGKIGEMLWVDAWWVYYRMVYIYTIYHESQTSFNLKYPIEVILSITDWAQMAVFLDNPFDAINRFHNTVRLRYQISTQKR